MIAQPSSPVCYFRKYTFLFTGLIYYRELHDSQLRECGEFADAANFVEMTKRINSEEIQNSHADGENSHT